jgi:hypothetical protein
MAASGMLLPKTKVSTSFGCILIFRSFIVHGCIWHVVALCYIFLLPSCEAAIQVAFFPVFAGAVVADVSLTNFFY